MSIHGEQNQDTTQTGGRDGGGLLARALRILQLLEKPVAHVTSASEARS